MSIDDLSQKYQRSIDQLDKFGKDFTQKVDGLFQQFSGVTKLLEDLQNEKKKLNSQNTDEEAKIASINDEINSKSMKKQELENQLDSAKKELENVNNNLNNEESEKKKLGENISIINDKVNTLTIELTQTKDRIEKIQKENAELNRKLDEELKVKKADNTKLNQELLAMKEERGVVSFLIEESAENINEADILMTVMRKGKATKSDLKDELEGKVTPVIITRTLGRLVDKNILKYSEADDEYSLL